VALGTLATPWLRPYLHNACQTNARNYRKCSEGLLAGSSDADVIVILGEREL